MRALAYVTAASLDFAHKHPDEKVRKEHKAFVEFMIPVVKGWCTEKCDRALLDRVASLRRHGLRRGDRHRAAIPRRAHHHDLRRHDRHSSARPGRPQADPRHGRDRDRRRSSKMREGRQGDAQRTTTPTSKRSAKRSHKALATLGRSLAVDRHERDGRPAQSLRLLGAVPASSGASSRAAGRWRAPRRSPPRRSPPAIRRPSSTGPSSRRRSSTPRTCSRRRRGTSARSSTARPT